MVGSSGRIFGLAALVGSVDCGGLLLRGDISVGLRGGRDTSPFCGNRFVYGGFADNDNHVAQTERQIHNERERGGRGEGGDNEIERREEGGNNPPRDDLLQLIFHC